MLENKTIQGYKYIKVDDVNIAYLSAVIPSNGMGTLSVNVQVMSKDMLEDNKEYFLEEYKKFKQDVEEEARINCGWNVFAKEEDEIIGEQPEDEGNTETEPPIDEDIAVKEEGVEYPSEDLDIHMGVYPEEM